MVGDTTGDLVRPLWRGGTRSASGIAFIAHRVSASPTNDDVTWEVNLWRRGPAHAGRLAESVKEIPRTAQFSWQKSCANAGGDRFAELGEPRV
jgi:hypothetical protein